MLFLAPLVAAQIIFIPIYCAENYFNSFGSPAPGLHFLLTMIVAPVYLGFMASRSVVARHPLSYSFSLLLIGLLLIVPLDYVVWGVTSGRFWHPDHMTVLALEFLGAVGLPLAVVPPLVVLILQRFRSHRSQNN